MSEAAGIIDWIQESLWSSGEWQARGAALVLFVWLALTVFRINRSAFRVVVWQTTLIALLVIPLIGGSLPRWQVLPKWSLDQSLEPERMPAMEPIQEAIPARPPVVPPVILDPIGPREQSPLPLENGLGVLAPVNDVDQQRVSPHSLADIVFWAWIGGIGCILARVALGAIALRHVGRGGRRVQGGFMYLKLQQASEAMGVKKEVPLYLVKRDIMPMTVGAFVPKLFFPDTAEHWSKQRIEAVMIHEMAHVKRRDCLILLFAQLACAFHWISPFVWWAKNQWIREREQVCDDHVIDTGVSRKVYASTLLELGTRLNKRPISGSAAVLSSGRTLEPRIDRILDQNRSKSRGARRRICLAVCMVLGLAWGLAAVDSLIPSEPSAADRMFTKTVSDWAISGIRESYPSMPADELKAIGAHLEKFFNGVLATNTVSQARKTQLLESMEPSIAKQFYRGGANGLKAFRGDKTDKFGRPLSDMTLEDDLLTLKWKLWRVLTMPELTKAQRNQLAKQHQMLNAYLLHREQLIVSFLEKNDDGSSINRRVEKDRYDWRSLREWVLLQQSYSDPLGSVFDRPLSDEGFGETIEFINNLLKEAGVERSRNAIDALPTVRHIGTLIKEKRYPLEMVSAEFELPFIDRVVSIHGPRSWDDPVHLRLTFDSNHPERYNKYPRPNDFRVVPPLSNGNQPMSRYFGKGRMPMDWSADEVEMAMSELDHAGGGNPKFLFPDDGFGRDILSEVAFRSKLSVTEQASVRAVLIVEKVEGLDALESYALTSSIDTERSGIAKILALGQKQQTLINSYEKVVLMPEFPASKGATLKRLIKQMKQNTVERLFSVRERFSGAFEEGNATTSGVLRSRQAWKGEIYYERFRIADYERFPIQIEGEREPAFFVRYVQGNDSAIIIQLEPTVGASSMAPRRIELSRSQRKEIDYQGRKFRFLFDSPLQNRSSEESLERPFVHLAVTYLPTKAQ